MFKYVAQGKGGIIVESLTDGRRTMVGGSAKVSALGDIAVFTVSAEVSLGDVLQSAYDKHAGKPVALPSKASPEELRAFMVSILPDYDVERVHNSDIRKIGQWYNALVAAGMTSFTAAEESGEAADAAVTGDSADVATETPKKKVPAKKAAVASANAAAKRTPKAESRSKAPAARSTTVRKAQ